MIFKSLIIFILSLQDCFVSATMNAFSLDSSGEYYISEVLRVKEEKHSETFINGYKYKVLIANSDGYGNPYFDCNSKQVREIEPKKDTTITFKIKNINCTSMVILFKR